MVSRPVLLANALLALSVGMFAPNVLGAPIYSDSGAATAGPQCDKDDERGGTCRSSEDDGAEGRGPAPPSTEPKPGSTWTQEHLASPCSTEPPGRNPDDACTRMSSECPKDFWLSAVWNKDWYYTGSTWVVVSDPEWYRANPFEQCRLVGESALGDEDVRVAVQRFGLPAAKLEMWPVGAKTLVQFESIFYSDTPVAEFPLNVDGTIVDIRATPTTFHWDFGNARRSTPHAGAPWTEGGERSDYVIHVYDRPGTYAARVEVEYQVEWNAGDGWNTIPHPILGQRGPSVDVEVVETAAVTTGG